MKKRSLALFLSVVMLMSVLVGCGTKEEINPSIEKEDNSIEVDKDKVNDVSPIKTSSEGLTVLELKQLYGVADRTEIKPFYNVEQNTEFTFHFNSYVNPFTAITVHTDSKCGLNSMVYQFNTGYSTGSGMDVVVSPFQPVLNTADEKKLEYGNWGYAPIYYLCINYDLYSTTPIKLDTPIVVPFTVRNSISVPNAEGFVTNDGSFGLKWKPVENAVKYNIYKASSFSDGSEDEKYTRSELGYEGDFLDLLTSVDSSTLEFTDFRLDNSDNTSSINGYISYQNFYDLDNYYITAVDKDGNESFYSYPIEGWKYTNRLPYNFDVYSNFVRDDEYNITSLPEVVNVTLKDKSTMQFPISYTKISEQYGEATYKYTIANTKLNGQITVLFEDGSYPQEIDSTYSFDTGMYIIDSNFDKVPNVSINTISDSDYTDVPVNLDKVVTRNYNGMITYTREMGYTRADIEAARMINDGVYGENNPFTILYDNPQFIAYFDDEGNQMSFSTVQGTYRDITMDGGKGTGNSITSIVIDGNVIYEDTSNGESVSVPVEDTSTISKDDYINHEIPEEITSENIVEEQIISTEKQVAESNDTPVVEVSYPVFADSAEEEYIARNMIAGENYIDLSAFPSLQNVEYLVDVIQKVVYQNPYILNTTSYGYDYETRTLVVEYALTKDEIAKKQEDIFKEAETVVSSIIKEGMSNEEKILAIWTYLENNTIYDNEALEYAESVSFSNSVLEKYPDTFSTYGILCNKKGVCQSYAMVVKLLCSLCDVDSVVLTGYLDKTLPHAWNAVKLNDAWYWIDTTNNETNMGVPYFLYQTSSTYAEYAGFVTDDGWALDPDLYMCVNTDNSRDFYATHNLLFANISDALKSLLNVFIDSDSIAVVKCVNEDDLASLRDNFNEVIGVIAKALLEKGYTQEELMGITFQEYHGLLFLIKG